MGFSSIDALVAAISASGQINRIPFVKTVQTGATTAAGRWHELLSLAGTGGGMTLTGTAGAGIACTGATVGSIPVGPNVGGAATRHLLGMSAWTPSVWLSEG